MNLRTYLCIAKAISSLFILGTLEESGEQEAQNSGFPSLKLEASGSSVVSHLVMQRLIWKSAQA